MVIAQAGLDSGSTAWLLMCAALVMVMTPGVAFFYGGMVRPTNVLATLMQSFAILGLVTVLWVAVGFSLAFGGANGFVGGLDFAGLTDIDKAIPGISEPGVPTVAFVVFQLMFAIITPALITGAGAERWRFGAMIFFVAAWSLLVYAPVAHWLFSPTGWAAELGALDFAGGAVVHANAGAAALVVAARLGRRTGWPDPRLRPHNLPMVFTGAALLWFGWFGFNGGSALAADGIASIAVLNTQVAAAAALLAWALAERLRFGKATTLGAASGAVAGLVAVTPAAGYVSPWVPWPSALWRASRVTLPSVSSRSFVSTIPSMWPRFTLSVESLARSRSDSSRRARLIHLRRTDCSMVAATGCSAHRA